MRWTIWTFGALAALASTSASKAQGQAMPETMPAAQTPDQGSMDGMVVDPMDMSHGMSGMNMDMNMSGAMMTGATGVYAMTRDASGTAWQPDSTPMEGIHTQFGDWSAMFHGYINAVYDKQGGARGGSKSFSESMLMAMAQRPVGEGTLTLRTMLSLDPFMEKAVIRCCCKPVKPQMASAPLVDRQHPHDLFMELAGVYSHPIGDTSALSLYVGYPGEPALGPATFMHRFSGLDNPAAPIAHHWLDSTHITFGVVTAGFTGDTWKIEASVFNGREPDQFRWNFDTPRFDFASARLNWNPSPNWSLQVSHGFIKTPEQLEPTVSQHRTTASVSYNLPMENGNWQTTFAWGRNGLSTGPDLNAFLLESAITWFNHTVFARAENADKNELFEPPSPLAGQTFSVSTFSLGYIYDFPVADHLKLGFGAMGSVTALPSAIQPAYGSNPASYMLFTRIKLF